MSVDFPSLFSEDQNMAINAPTGTSGNQDKADAGYTQDRRQYREESESQSRSFGSDNRGRGNIRGSGMSWGEALQTSGWRSTTGGNADASQIVSLIKKVVEAPTALSTNDVAFTAMVMSGAQAGVPNELSCAVLAATHVGTGCCYFIPIFGNQAVAEFAARPRDVPHAERSFDSLNERPNTIVEAMFFDSPFGRDGDSHLTLMTRRVAEVIGTGLNRNVVANPTGIVIYTATGAGDAPSAADEEAINQWLAVLENRVIGNLETDGVITPSYSFTDLSRQHRRLSVTTQIGLPDAVAANGIVTTRSISFIVTAGGDSGRDFDENGAGKFVIGRVHGRVELIHNPDFGYRRNENEYPFRVVFSINGFESTIPSPAISLLSTAAVLTAIDDDGAATIRAAALPVPSDRGFRDIHALARANGMPKSTSGELDEESVNNPHQLLLMLVNPGVEVRVDFDPTDLQHASQMWDVFMAAYGNDRAVTESSDRIFGCMEKYFGVKLKEYPAISQVAGIMYTGSLQIGAQLRSLQAYDLIAGLTSHATPHDVDTNAYCAWAEDAPGALLTVHASFLKRVVPTAKFFSIAFGLRLRDGFMSVVMDALSTAGFTVRSIGSMADGQTGRAPHFVASNFAANRRDSGRRGGSYSRRFG